MTKDILGGFGYKNVSDASNGKEALKSISEKQCDLLILDMQMPEMNGYEVIGRLKENRDTANIPIIVLSAFKVDVDKINEHVTSKAIPVIEKPCDENILKRWVNFLL